jgi:hypothetical protein
MNGELLINATPQTVHNARLLGNARHQRGVTGPQLPRDLLDQGLAALGSFLRARDRQHKTRVDKESLAAVKLAGLTITDMRDSLRVRACLWWSSQRRGRLSKVGLPGFAGSATQ